VYQVPRPDHGYPTSPHEQLTLEDTVGGQYKLHESS
jgi:hypothetical protein